MIKKIKEKFKDEIQEIFFEKEDGLIFLRVQVNEVVLEKVTIIARNISKFLDENDYLDQEYYLDVYSSGAEKNIDKTELENYIGENIFVELEQPVKGFNEFEGEIIEASKEEFMLKWNAKGQFRKVSVKIKNIKSIRMSLKISKRK